MNTTKRIIILLTVFMLAGTSVFGQELITAIEFFNSVSENYGDVNDYEAELSITQVSAGKTEVSMGRLYYKTPNLLRIDFSVPEEQVVCVTGTDLMIYIPSQVVVMTQKLKRHNDATLATMASSQGLELLKKGYSISYLTGPAPVPIDEGSTEMVTKLKLEWRNTEQGFRQIEMSVSDRNYIRRMKAVTPEMEEVQFDFTGIKVNQNIPDARFVYEAPPSAYEIKNFLFEPEG